LREVQGLDAEGPEGRAVTWEGLLIGLAVFVSAALYDAIFASYVRAAATGKAFRAALCSVGTYMVGAVGLLALVKLSVWYVLPEAGGLFVGTLAGVAASQDKD
jgi:hypothetical protein